MNDFLAASVAARPERIALTDGRTSWSYRGLDARVREVTDALGRRGAVTGRTAAVVTAPSAEGVVALHALFRTGARVAPLNPGLAPAELGRALDTLDPALVLVDRASEAGVRDAVGRDSGRVIVTVAEVLADREGEERAVTTSGSGETGGASGDPAAVLWTSGTSGRPRGVLLSAQGLGRSAMGSRDRLGLGPDDRWYASLSPAHVGGLALVTRAALLGSALVATGSFGVDELSRLVDEGAVTHASLVPTMLLRLLDQRHDRPPPPTLRCLLVGGAACPVPLVERALAAGFPVALTYGLTEATSQVATAPPDLVRRKPGTVGPPLDGVELRVAASGEILVRGSTVAAGLVGTDEPLTDAGGWLATGDLGRLDDEGHLWVTGRGSDRIVTGGVNVDPAAVEAVLVAHPAVAEAAVVGLPDPEWGERVEAAVVTDGVHVLDAEAVRVWARERLGGPRTPKRVTAVDALPRNANGKVDRAAVRRMLAPAGER